jgi:hypothetical protein
MLKPAPGPDLAWLSDMKTKFIEWVDFDETHRMDRFDQPEDRAKRQRQQVRRRKGGQTWRLAAVERASRLGPASNQRLRMSR